MPSFAARQRRHNVDDPLGYYNMAACGGKRYQNSLLKEKLLTAKLVALGFFLAYVCVLCAIHGTALIKK